MKLKFISDGTSTGAKVINAETGEELEHVLSATISLSPHECIANMTIFMPDVEVALDGSHVFIETIAAVKE